MVSRRIHQRAFCGLFWLAVLVAIGVGAVESALHPAPNATPAQYPVFVVNAVPWTTHGISGHGNSTIWVDDTLRANGHATVFTMPPLPVRLGYADWVDITISVGGAAQQIAVSLPVPRTVNPTACDNVAFLNATLSRVRFCTAPRAGTLIRVMYRPDISYTDQLLLAACQNVPAGESQQCVDTFDSKPVPEPTPAMMP